MSPLEAAKRLAAIDPYYDWADGAPDPEMVCIACSRYRKAGHDGDCPILALPRIVAALEAAERLTERFGNRSPIETEDTYDGDFAIAHACCGGNFYSPHMEHCPWQALERSRRHVMRWHVHDAGEETP